LRCTSGRKNLDKYSPKLPNATIQPRRSFNIISVSLLASDIPHGCKLIPLYWVLFLV
jgi:hypothetical protein